MDFTAVHRIGRCLWTPLTQLMPQHARLQTVPLTALGACVQKKNFPSSFPFPPSPPSPPPPSCMITLLFLSLSIHIDHVRGEHAIQVHRICACHAEFTHQSIITRCFSVILLGFVLIVLIVIIVSSMTPITVMRENGFCIKRTATTHPYSFPAPSSSLPPPVRSPARLETTRLTALPPPVRLVSRRHAAEDCLPRERPTPHGRGLH